MKKFSLLILLPGAFLNVQINLYRLGGPHTALQEMAKPYEEKTGIRVNVNFGPKKLGKIGLKKMQIFFLGLQINLQ